MGVRFSNSPKVLSNDSQTDAKAKAGRTDEHCHQYLTRAKKKGIPRAERRILTSLHIRNLVSYLPLR